MGKHFYCSNSVAGALSGAFLGLDALPHLKSEVNDKGTWKKDELVNLCQKLYQIKCKR